MDIKAAAPKSRVVATEANVAPNFTNAERRTLQIVFGALLIDIFSFSIILPLLPRLLDHYSRVEGTAFGQTGSLLAWLMAGLDHYKSLVNFPAAAPPLDIVLFGGALSALFSLLQSLASPVIGRLSDRFGRRPILLACMLGNILSCTLWTFANRFPLFLLARIVAGLSEGNVQLSVAIISDISSPQGRARALSLVGIAFATGFTLGPSFGALATSWHSSTPATALKSVQHIAWHPFSAPALLSLILVAVEFIFIAIWFPETAFRQPPSDKENRPKPNAGPSTMKIEHHNQQQQHEQQKNQNQKRESSAAARSIERLHFAFIFLFSGLEFTLPFLSFQLLDFSNKQQGAIFATVGVVSALVQGTYTRRFSRRIGEHNIAAQGMVACAAAYLTLAIAPHLVYPAALLLAFTSATVVTSLTTISSILSPDQAASGRFLGSFRAWGQMGRAIGPLILSACYWRLGPSTTYLLGFALVILVTTHLVVYIGPGVKRAVAHRSKMQNIPKKDNNKY